MSSDEDNFSQGYMKLDILLSPTERTEVTINAAHVVAAFELADS